MDNMSLSVNQYNMEVSSYQSPFDEYKEAKWLPHNHDDNIYL